MTSTLLNSFYISEKIKDREIILRELIIMTEKVMLMDEFEFINKITPTTYKQASLIKGIGDDTAVFRPSNVDVVTAVDTFVENVHFSKATMDAYDIGYRALTANLSDIAAMGATPKFYLVSIVVPESYSDNTLESIFAGMRELADQYSIDLIGGDTVSGQQLTISITIIGYVAQGEARYRHTAEDGDVVFVTGTLGDSRAGLEILLEERHADDAAYFIQRHRRPTARVHFAKALAELGRVTLNDVSDGLASELHEIAQASQVKIVIEDDKIPVHARFGQFTDVEQFDWKYFGGEDFELVGTARVQDWAQIKEIAEKVNIPITKIGTVAYNEGRDGQVYVQADGKQGRLEKHGYRHMSK